jgi:cysteine-rich repeat protein
MMQRWLVVMAAVTASLGGCVKSNSEMCSDGFVCPKGDACRMIVQSDGNSVHYCASQDQLGECGDALAPCADSGSCHEGVCIPSACGNMLLDVAEACDNGDTAPGNGCSADCLSDETCGNGLVDPLQKSDGAPGEECDDGDGVLVAHDGCSSACKAETLTWKDIHYGWREGAAIAWDGNRGRIVLFGGSPLPITPGGYYADEVSGETWELEDGRWELRDVGFAPAPRVHHLMTYDEERRQVVLFGGDFQIGSTWTLGAEGWLAHTSAKGPLVNPFQSMAYDPIRKWVLYYGEGTIMGNNVPHETWAWDGATETWTLLSSSLSGNNPPLGGGMAFDRKRGVIVLQGDGSTWEHDGTGWSQSAVTSPTFTFGDPALAYDSTDQRMIVVGGGDPSQGNRKTWAFNGTTWTPLPDLPTAAAEVRDVTMATDEITGRVVVMAQRQTLTFTGTAWKVLQSEAAPPPLYRLFSAVALDPTHHEMLLFGGTTTSGSFNDTWLWKGFWEKQTGTMPSARVRASLAYDSVRDAMIMLGGAPQTTDPAIDDVWLWKNHAWGAVGGARPPKRQGGAMAFDAKRGEMVLFGGADDINASTVLSDTWTWNGTQWTQHTPGPTPGPQPQARYSAAMGYDPVRERIVMFGGHPNATSFDLDDTWEWDGTAWTEAPRGPQPRENGSLVWDDAAKKLLLIGGQTVPFNFDEYSTEVWSFDGTWHALPASATPNPSPYVTPTIDGTGIAVFTSSTGYNGSAGDEIDTVWRLRWESGEADEACGQSDTDGDGAIGCADPDCAYLCPP